MLQKSIFLNRISQYDLPIMKDLLYLKDEQIKDFIQLLYDDYREISSDPKEILSKKLFGLAHLRALNLIERYPGINPTELIFKLKITKQSLNRVLRELVKMRLVKEIKNEDDTRKKNLMLTKDGQSFFDKLYESQKSRMFYALKKSDPSSVIKFKEVLSNIINGKK